MYDTLGYHEAKPMIPRPTAPDADATFGQRVREGRRRLRTTAGRRWTQSELARAVGVERNTVSRWENGGVRPKDPATLAALARVLRVSTDWLIDGRPLVAGTPAPQSRGAIGEPQSGAPDAPWGAMGGGDALKPFPAEVRDLLGSYRARLVAAGATVAQLTAAERVLVEGGMNALAERPFAERPCAEIAADVDAAWDFITSVLRRDGLRP